MMDKTLNSKLETLNKPETQNSKQYNLGARTLSFAKNVFIYVNALPRSLSNIEVGKQLIRSSGSVGANYLEAEEALSRRDFVMRIKISRKEAKESGYWLNLSETKDGQQIEEKKKLVQEANELMKIFGAIVEKSK